jgi:hypothetical protein
MKKWIFPVLGVCILVLLHSYVVERGIQGHSELLCSDGRCGQSSKLSREGADRDLDLWADKEELKNKLDELQTVMDRGMTHKSAAQQLNQYFNQLDQKASDQRKQALRQAKDEGLPDNSISVLSSRFHQRPVILKDNSSPSHVSVDRKSKAKLHTGDTSKLSASAAVADLNAYFDSLPTSRRASKVHYPS